MAALAFNAEATCAYTTVITRPECPQAHTISTQVAMRLSKSEGLAAVLSGQSDIHTLPAQEKSPWTLHISKIGCHAFSALVVICIPTKSSKDAGPLHEDLPQYATKKFVEENVQYAQALAAALCSRSAVLIIPFDA